MQNGHGMGHEGVRRVVRRSNGDGLALPGQLDHGRRLGSRRGERIDGRRRHDDAERVPGQAEAIEHLVDGVARLLEQEAMAVLVTKASDGYLLFPDEP